MIALAVALAVSLAFPAVGGAHRPRGPGGGDARYDRAGNLVSFSAEPTLSEPARLSPRNVRRAAVRFLTRYVHWFNARDFHLLSGRISHEQGDALTALTYRTLIRGIPGPAFAKVEVDRRTGRVVSEDAIRVHPTTTIFRVSRRQAIRTARRAVHAQGQIRSATRDIWRNPEWNVVIFFPGVLFGNTFAYVTVNGSTGHVEGVAGT